MLLQTPLFGSRGADKSDGRSVRSDRNNAQLESFERRDQQLSHLRESEPRRLLHDD
jgi:hypothetical protein